MSYTVITPDFQASPDCGDLELAQNHLKKNGWTQRAVAQRFGITESYLSRVLGGELKSKRLIKAIAELGPNPTPAKRPNYA